MIEVLESGPLNALQDLGRWGGMGMGVARSGAMDPLSLRLGNMLLGNADDAAAMEVAFFPFSVRFLDRGAFAVTGAPVEVSLDRRRLPGDFATVAEPGQVLTLEPGRDGVFAYLCVAGGFEAAVVRGSRSTDLKSGFGGLGGRAPRTGSRLAFGNGGAGARLPERGIGVSPRAAPGRLAQGLPTIRFIAGAEWDGFGIAAQDTFLESRWTVSREVNRTGYRLSGPVLEPKRRTELFSHGVVPGVIQAPPSGQPIVQMVEANTCGGYPKLGVVIGADLPVLAQQRSGRQVVFQQVDREAALLAREAQRTGLREIARGLDLMRDRPEQLVDVGSGNP